jgi:beta-fructofuranosidase
MSDQARPRLHLTPRNGWLNDPLALTWLEDEDGGRYHLFFQHVPDSVVWAARCTWGHATSHDLLHWSQHPVALEPAEDELGAWSGCLVEGRILYTSVTSGDVERGRVRVAGPAEDGRWVPGEVLIEAPVDRDVGYFRDPFVLRDGDTWRMLVGAGLADGTGCALGYRSDDLTSWAYDGVVAARHTDETDPVWTGAIWECPQLLRLPECDVLVLSPADARGPGDVVAAVGTFTGGRFDVSSWQPLTAGAPYAASVFHDRDGRPGLVAWLRGVTGEGWAGAVSTPLLLGLSGGRLRLEPHPVLQDRRRPWDPAAMAWEIEWEGDGDLALLRPDGAPAARVRATVDRLELSAGEERVTVEHDHGPVRVLRDGPVLEVLAGGRLAALPLSASPLRPRGDGWRGWALA